MPGNSLILSSQMPFGQKKKKQTYVKSYKIFYLHIIASYISPSGINPISLSAEPPKNFTVKIINLTKFQNL